MANQPLLSIGMIFKNEIRCLERSLKALQPLRDAVPCELIMADTGSNDGSRAVAARYADILFDFPWIDDFSAARNAVMDRASGEWFLTVDADEYLDPDVSELTDFLRHSSQRETAGIVIQRNYTTLDMDGEYSDFSAFRLLRMSTGYRYKGTIHEAWEPVRKDQPKLVGKVLTKTILHHDGYVGLMEERGKPKRKRNLELLREALAETPDNLRRLQQFIESGIDEPDCLNQLQHAVELIESHCPEWEDYGPPIFRYAVAFAVRRELPETDAWIQRAEEWFPNSYFTLIDVSALAFGECWNRKQDYAACIRYGERYLAACVRYEADADKMFMVVQGSVSKASSVDQQNMKVFLSAAYLRERQPEKALALMESVRFTLMDQQMTGILTKNLLELQESCTLDTAPLVTAAWEGLTAPEPSQERADDRRAVFYNNAVPVFSAGYRDIKACDDCRRPAYTAFLPLKGKCALGTAAAILESRDSREAAELLGQITSWHELPHAAILHVVRLGTAFPPPDRPVYLEELDELAIRAAQEPKAAAELLERALEAAQDLRGASWARALAMASLLACTWEDEAEGMSLARRFAEAEAAFLSRCYGPEALTPEGLSQLPSMHRFGWYCVQAFEALDHKDPAGYARLLRRGLEVCENAKPVVKFLLEHTLQRPDPELLALAEQVRTMLAAYPADDPAVAALKASPAYQEVAHLIEGEQK